MKSFVSAVTLIALVLAHPSAYSMGKKHRTPKPAPSNVPSPAPSNAPSPTPSNAPSPTPSTLPPVGVGQYSLTIAERQTADSAVKSVGGVSVSTYTRTLDGLSERMTQTRAFTGTLSVAVSMNGATLSEWVIQDSKGRTLFALDQKALEDLGRESKFGAKVTVLVTLEGNVAPEFVVEPVTQLPPGAKPDLTYRPLTTEFADPSELLRTADVVGAQKRIRVVSSATPKFHEELLKLIQDAKVLDADHLKLVLSGVYFSFESAQAIDKRRVALEQKHDLSRDEEAELAQINANLDLASQLGRYTNAVLNVGLPKVEGLTISSAKELLSLAFPQGNLAGAFGHLIQSFSPISPEEKLGLMDLALQKAESQGALAFGLLWFSQDSDKSIEALKSLLKKFEYNLRDQLLLAAIPSMGPLRTQEVQFLIGASYDAKVQVAQTAFPHISSYSPSDLVSVSSQLSYGPKDQFLAWGLKLFLTVRSAEAASIVGASYDAKLVLAQTCLGKLSDPSGSNLGLIAAQLSYGPKDQVLIQGLGLLTKVTLDEAVLLVSASYDQKVSIATGCLSKIQGLAAAGVLRVAGLLNYGPKDQFLNASFAVLGALTSAEAAALTGASYDAKLSVAQKAMAKVGALDVKGLLQIAAQLSYGNKDSLLVLGMERFAALEPSEVASLASASYDAKGRISQAGLAKVKVLSPDGILTIAAAVQYADKDTVISLGMARLSRVTAQELVSLASASNGSADSILLSGDRLLPSLTTADCLLLVRKSGYQKFATQAKYFAKISDLTAANGITLASEFSYGERDLVLKAVLAQFKQVTTSELQGMAAIAYDIKSWILVSQMSKVSDLTVANAIKIAATLSYGDKDIFLVAAVDLVTDLSTSNLSSLGKAAYEKENQILQKGLKRLGGG